MRHRDRRLFLAEEEEVVFSLSPSELYLRIIPQLYEVPARQTENNVESRSFKDDLLWVLVVLPLTFVLLVSGLFGAYHYHGSLNRRYSAMSDDPTIKDKSRILMTCRVISMTC